MNKSELIDAIADWANLDKKDSKAALKAMIEVISVELKKGDKVQITGFGTFGVKQRKARTGVNPRDNTPIKIPAKKVPFFKPGSELKDMID